MLFEGESSFTGKVISRNEEEIPAKLLIIDFSAKQHLTPWCSYGEPSTAIPLGPIQPRATSKAIITTKPATSPNVAKSA